MTWTPAITQEIEDRWKAGETLTEIAAALKITRSAVAGKLARMNLQRERKYRPTPPPRPAPARIHKPVHPWRPPEPAPDAPAPAVPAIQPLLKPLQELNSDTCRYPIGDPASPGFGFCALPVWPGKPYCAEHCTLCFQLPRQHDRAQRKGD